MNECRAISGRHYLVSILPPYPQNISPCSLRPSLQGPSQHSQNPSSPMSASDSLFLSHFSRNLGPSRSQRLCANFPSARNSHCFLLSVELSLLLQDVHLISLSFLQLLLIFLSPTPLLLLSYCSLQMFPKDLPSSLHVCLPRVSSSTCPRAWHPVNALGGDSARLGPLLQGLALGFPESP